MQGVSCRQPLVRGGFSFWTCVQTALVGPLVSVGERAAGGGTAVEQIHWMRPAAGTPRGRGRDGRRRDGAAEHAEVVRRTRTQLADVIAHESPFGDLRALHALRPPQWQPFSARQPLPFAYLVACVGTHQARANTCLPAPAVIPPFPWPPPGVRVWITAATILTAQNLLNHHPLRSIAVKQRGPSNSSAKG